MNGTNEALVYENLRNIHFKSGKANALCSAHYNHALYFANNAPRISNFPLIRPTLCLSLLFPRISKSALLILLNCKKPIAYCCCSRCHRRLPIQIAFFAKLNSHYRLINLFAQLIVVKQLPPNLLRYLQGLARESENQQVAHSE